MIWKKQAEKKHTGKGDGMKIWQGLKEKENMLWAIGGTVVFFLLIGLCFDFYYDLNDDVLMKDIVAGAYTGEPEGRNIQLLFPLSFLLGCLYRLTGAVPWYGVFLCGCHVLCFFLTAERALGVFRKRYTKVIALTVQILLAAAVLLRDLVFVQYTVTSALLGATAAFLTLTARGADSALGFLKHCFPGILLAVISFLLRQKMLLLLLPLLCTAGIFRWAEESGPLFSGKNLKKYFGVFGVLLAGLMLCQGIHTLGYGSAEWKAFWDFFNSRTELYDFQTVPPYEQNEAFYQSIGMTENQQTLLENYNFGLDEEIDADCLEQVAAYAAEQKKAQTNFAGTVRNAFENYRYRSLHETDYPWNLFVGCLYVLVFATVLWLRRFRYLWEPVLLAVVRTGLWMFILYRGRAPERITHSLYLAELMILLGLLLTEWAKAADERKHFAGRAGVLAALLLLSLTAIPDSLERTSREYRDRETLNLNIQALENYTRLHPDCFYFVDVYSTVAYSEKMFSGKDGTLKNYDIMGGWASRSPLNRKKLDGFSMETMEEGLLDRENTFVVVQNPEPDNLPALETWLSEYYRERGISVTLEKEDAVYLGNEEIFSIYSVVLSEKT